MAMIFRSVATGTVATGTVLLAAATILTGCLASPDPQGPTPTATGSPEPSAGDRSELTITVDNGHGTVKKWQLVCHPASGTHPNPEAACDALAQSAATALPAVAADSVCAEIYGGPETATITGTWDGKTVDSRFSRINACEMARWDALKAAFVT